MRKSGGRFLARGQPAKVYEAGVMERTVVIEFDSAEQAIAAYESPGYQEALRVLGNGAERDLRIVEAEPPRPYRFTLSISPTGKPSWWASPNPTKNPRANRKRP
jgi:hypothetical protein